MGVDILNPTIIQLTFPRMPENLQRPPGRRVKTSSSGERRRQVKAKVLPERRRGRAAHKKGVHRVVWSSSRLLRRRLVNFPRAQDNYESAAAMSSNGSDDSQNKGAERQLSPAPAPATASGGFQDPT